MSGNPYDNIQFEQKHIQIFNSSNEIIFDEFIEFPKDFDENAATIVASRYLTNNSNKKEQSIKDMIDRVSNTITLYGKNQNYFIDLDETEFSNRLKIYQIHRLFAFNSPVYFNVGINEPAQTSACFILNIEDNMDSITEFSKTEAKIFKNGSGSGTNLSTLRSSKESVSGGGFASGPVSFLKSQDVLGGIIKSGGTLRRSAKLACLNIDHPDIEEFINCKIFEEEKLNILRLNNVKARSGYDLSDEVFFQNTNLSVRVTDEFMKAVIEDSTWNTKFVKTGKIYKTYKARDLLKQIAKTSWRIAEPGIQFHDTINNWNTLKDSGEIVSSNPCSEFMSLNDTSCNLASINLLNFFSFKDYIFDLHIKLFEDVIKTVVTAQDIIIDTSKYPNSDIERNTKKFRNIGLGFTNLGGLLMWLGIPYDSKMGRIVASVLTATMTGVAYTTSADLADNIGSFEEFENNKTSFKKVLLQHYDNVVILNNQLKTTEFDSKYNFIKLITDYCLDVWEKLIKRDKFRNAQISLLAPTGTISSIMNAVTTGIEPEYSLVRYKRLSGSEGATLKYTNSIITESLKNLGYENKYIPAIIDELIDSTKSEKTLIKPEHLDVFLSASEIPGTNKCINYTGHLKMCAAVQPFISGSISKTINLPKDCTVDDIYNLYIDAWKMGLKCVIIYRDGSKNFQPLSTQKLEQAKLIRKKLPMERKAFTHKFSVGESEGYLTCGLYEDTNELGEIFINVSKEGSTLSGFADALATVISISLQYGVPLEDIVRKLSYLKFEPNGFTSHKDIKIAYSIVDYIARYIGLKFLSPEAQQKLGLIINNNIIERAQISKSTEGAPCPNCGSLMRKLGSCYLCTNCGFNGGSCG